jgi:hypothetical protein
MKPNTVSRAFAPLLLLLALSLSACQASLPKPTPASPSLPLRPSASTPQPQTPYSTTASERIKNWRQKLTDTQVTP